MKLKLNWAPVAFVVLLFVMSCIYYSEQLHFWPQGIHDWAQADRLSLAISFYDHGMDLFHPRTHNIYSTDGITGVELPLQSYIAAFAGKILGRDHISACFRLLDIIISCTSLLFLFLACYKVTRDFVFSIFPPLFMYMSPIFIYYTCNYVPDTASCALAFGSFYFIINYLHNRSTPSMIWAIGLLTLASLIKTSEAIYLLGFLGFIFFQWFEKSSIPRKKANRSFIAAAIVSIGLIVLQYAYNQYLNTKYNSTVFLAKPNPFRDWQHAEYYFTASFKHVWVKEYLLLAQYPLFVGMVTIGIMLLYRDAVGKKQLRLLLLLLIGTACFTFLMGGQMLNHDYYAVSMYLPLWAISLLICTIAIRKYIVDKDALKLTRAGLISGMLICFFFADYHSHQRLQLGYIGYSPWQPLWFVGGKDFLKELNIPANEHIIVLNEDAPNTALIYFDRRGYHVPPAIMRNGRWLKAFAKKLNVRTIVFDNSFANNVINSDNSFAENFISIGVKDRMSVYQLRDK